MISYLDITDLQLNFIELKGKLHSSVIFFCNKKYRKLFSHFFFILNWPTFLSKVIRNILHSPLRNRKTFFEESRPLIKICRNSTYFSVHLFISRTNVNKDDMLIKKDIFNQTILIFVDFSK